VNEEPERKDPRRNPNGIEEVWKVNKKGSDALS